MAETRLVDLCSPVFRQIVAWGRDGSSGKLIDPITARLALAALLDRMRLDSRQQPQLGQQFLQVELPLLFFIDFMMHDVVETTGAWQEMAFERNELAGDEKFFDLLEQTLGNPSDTATERVDVYYQCMALGFTGTFDANSADLHRIFRRCALRLGLAPEIVETGQLTPEAYENLDLVTRRRPFDPRKWRRAALVAASLLIAVHIVNIWMFSDETDELTRQIERIGAYANLAPAYREPDEDAVEAPARIPVEDRVMPPADPSTSKNDEEDVSGGARRNPIQAGTSSNIETTPVGDAPATKTETTPVGDAPATKTETTPVGDAPATKTETTPVGDAPATKTEATPVGDAPATKTEATPVGDAPATKGQTTPVGDAPAPASSPAISSPPATPSGGASETPSPADREERP
jgi:hypothetical protein